MEGRPAAACAARCMLVAAFLAVRAASASELVRCMTEHPGEDNAQARLKCFEALARRDAARLRETDEPRARDRAAPPTSRLLADWNLVESNARPLSIQPYKLNYLLLSSRTDDRNQQPDSPAHGQLAPLDWDKNEVKFQFSLKTEVSPAIDFRYAGFDQMRLWFAYTQQSNWQAYKWTRSSPFRENNYEPEIIATLRRDPASAGAFKLLNLGFNHQSNGRSSPESRSWWRLYAQGGWEPQGLFGSPWLLGRVWWRVRERAYEDDNRDITRYVGLADFETRWHTGRSMFSVLYRNNLRVTDGRNRGFVQLDWSRALWKTLPARLHLQYTSGYGESLIDYNYGQQTIGIGLSFHTDGLPR